MFSKNQKFNAFKIKANEVIFHSLPQPQCFPANSYFLRRLSESSPPSLCKTKNATTALNIECSQNPYRERFPIASNCIPLLRSQWLQVEHKTSVWISHRAQLGKKLQQNYFLLLHFFCLDFTSNLFQEPKQ